MNGQWLTSTQVAQALGVNSRTLGRWRATKRGPEFVRYGPNSYRYPAHAFRAWLARSSTAELARAPSADSVPARTEITEAAAVLVDTAARHLAAARTLSGQADDLHRAALGYQQLLGYHLAYLGGDPDE